eukprot:GHVP01013843.1.p1 GENE.GHVP01013843.1~~GHVP01013843.1.p1  ORF type:complete len:349 (+),score=95.62 GHVP01013843.1:50-1096(+)
MLKILKKAENSEKEEDAEISNNSEQKENFLLSESSDEIVTPSVEIAAAQEEPVELSNIEKENISNIASGFRTVLLNKGKAANAKELGNLFFNGGDVAKALDFYSAAVRFCPPDSKEDLAVIYANRAAAHLKLGNYQATITNCDCAVELKENYEKAYMRRYRAHRELKAYSEALKNLEKVIEINPSAREEWAVEIEFLRKRRDIELEETKAEVIGKLKNFGNWALGKVGMSLDDFEVEQNESGQMKISVKPKGAPNESTFSESPEEPSIEKESYNFSEEANFSSQSSEGSGDHPPSSTDEVSKASGDSSFGGLNTENFLPESKPENKAPKPHLDLSEIRLPEASDFVQK